MHPFRRWPILFVLFASPLLAADPSGLEQATNRPGGDYRNFDMAAPNPSDCQAACKADPECRAFTYVKPGVQGPQARCWLKNDVPPAHRDPNCVSGVTVRAPDTGCGNCVATTCASACKGAIVLLCVAGGTTTNDGVACQRCIDTQCRK